MPLRKSVKRQSVQRSYAPTPEQATREETNHKILHTINSLMLEDRSRTQAAFDKVAPLINEIFCALANYDIRFDFGSFSLDSCHLEKIAGNEYSLLCPLKQLPADYVRLEGKESTGAWSVRLSRTYEESIDKVCWEDVSLPPDSNACRYFSTRKLLKVLMEHLKHAINDVIPNEEENDSKDRWVKCKEKNDMIQVEAKVSPYWLRFSLLPCIALNRDLIKSLAMEARISRVTNHMRLETSECAYLVAKPLPNHPEQLWRVTVNNIENNLVRKVAHRTECGRHCLFALALLSEKFFEEKKNKGLVPYYLTRMAFLQEFLKFPNENDWKAGDFTVRVERILRSLEKHLSQGDVKDIFTGTNIVAHRGKENLADLSCDVARLRSQFLGYFGS